MSLESEVNAVYRPRFEAATNETDARIIGEEWLYEAQVYAEKAGWTKAQGDRLVQDMKNFMAPRLRDIAQYGRTLTVEERWTTYVEPALGPWAHSAGIAVLAGSAVIGLFGLGWLILKFVRR